MKSDETKIKFNQTIKEQEGEESSVVISTSEQVNVFESTKQNKTENKKKKKKTFPCHAISISPNLSYWPFPQIKHSV